MSERNSELNARDNEMAQRIAKTLNESTESFDTETRAQLMMARHRALTHSRNKRAALAMALAASVLALVAAPWMLRQHASPESVDDVTYLSVEPEMLADMEMLAAIGEVQ